MSITAPILAAQWIPDIIFVNFAWSMRELKISLASIESQDQKMLGLLQHLP
jgi:hypothetical protein